jgi:hypothetical protein
MHTVNESELFISTSFNGSDGSDAFNVRMFSVFYNGWLTIQYVTEGQ